MKKKLCETCIYRDKTEYFKPCIIYSDDCRYYEREEQKNDDYYSKGDIENENT